ncbi:hypothetical protein WJX72_011398 [[Myrmecia] bisecta]|uniref:protein disulfide-isomerase n=1 Tax=[Myrmecia] bisecta TaxID=41462 RepID=A0AAW1P694_9CHLO
MRSRACAALLLTACLGSLLTARASEEAVFTVTGANFEDLIKSNDFVAAEFYAPWCGHCKKLTPEWEKAAGELKKNDPPVVLAKVDATEEGNKALAQKYGVQGYPTIKIFRNGDLEKAGEYNGPRDADGIVDYLSKQVGPATKELKDGAAVKAFQGKDVGAMGIFASNETDEFQAFAKAAEALRDDIEFGHTFAKVDPKLTPDVKAQPAVVLYKTFDAPITVYEGNFDAAEIQAWLEKESVPLLLELSQSPKHAKNLQKVFSDPKPKLLGFVSEHNRDTDAYKAALTDLSKSSDKVNVLFVETGANAGALSFFGLKEEDCPAYVIHDQAGNAKFIAKSVKPGDLTKFMSDFEAGNAKFIAKSVKPGDLTKFMSDFEAGKLEKSIKSEEPPQDNDAPVTIVVAKEFDKIVMGDKDVFIMFHAPWCGHCKKLSPIIDEVGEAFADNKDVVIAKMDATANDVPNDKFEVKGFPTLFFVKKDGSIVPYSGNRTKEDLVEFVQKQSGAKAATEAADEDDEYEEEEEAPAAKKSKDKKSQDKEESKDEL